MVHDERIDKIISDAVRELVMVVVSHVDFLGLNDEEKNILARNIGVNFLGNLVGIMTSDPQEVHLPKNALSALRNLKKYFRHRLKVLKDDK